MTPRSVSVTFTSFCHLEAALCQSFAWMRNVRKINMRFHRRNMTSQGTTSEPGSPLAISIWDETTFDLPRSMSGETCFQKGVKCI